MERPLSVSATEARFLANFVSMLNCKTILEIGMGFGYSSAWLGRGLSLCSDPQAVYTVDNGTESALGDRGLRIAKELWERTGVANIISPIFGTSPQVLADLSNLEVDLAFIDGEHRGKQPLLDYRATLEHLTPNGCIVFHDVQAKYSVKEAVSVAESDGFQCIPLNTSCEPVVAIREASHQTTVAIALSLAKRGLLLGSDKHADNL
jgi:predicted O-methyltransferase YrrM